ncbi:MAG: YihY/virulence factor BrkB family protein [Draconibacterium sp.]
MPLYDVALFFWRSIVDGSITTRASAIAFSFFMAFFPFVIFLFTLIPYIPINNFQEELFDLIKQVSPGNTFDIIASTMDTIEDILFKKNVSWLSIGFFMSLIFSTNGLASMMSAFDATIHSIHRRSWLSQRIAAIYLLLILSVLLTIAIALIISGQRFINYLMDHEYIRDSLTVYLFTISKWIITISLFFFAYSFLYYMAPAKKTKWRFISAGGTLATALSLISFIGFNYYINNFQQYNKLYGSIGTLLIILLLMYLMSLILLIGFELNASIYQARTNLDDEE